MTGLVSGAVARLQKKFATIAGAAMVGVDKPGPAQTLQQHLDMLYYGIANVRDTQFAGGAKGDGVTDDTAAFLAAFAASNVVYAPPGNYLVGNLPINKNHFTFKGAANNQTVLIAKAVAQITLEVATTASVSFLVMEDLKLIGNATAHGGIKLGSSATFYCAGAMLNRVGVYDYARAVTTNGFGIQLACVQNLTIHNCWIYRNRHQIQRLQGTGYATSVRISGKTGYIGEGYIGVYIDSQIDDIYIDDVVIEGNSNSGIVITSAAVAAGRGTCLYLNGVYLEMNNATGAGVVSVTGNATIYQQHVVVIDRCNFAVNTGFYVTLDRTITTIKSTKIEPGKISTTVNNTLILDGNRFPSAADYLTTCRALLGTVTVRDTNDPVNGTTPNQINLLNAITFPTVARPVDDATTLDDYREGTWTPVLSSDAVAPTHSSLEPAEGSYTKIGRLVYVRGKVRVNITAAGTGQARITGLPFVPKAGLEPIAIGLATALAAAPGASYVNTSSAVVIGAAWKTITDGYFVFTATYECA